MQRVPVCGNCSTKQGVLRYLAKKEKGHEHKRRSEQEQEQEQEQDDGHGDTDEKVTADIDEEGGFTPFLHVERWLDVPHHEKLLLPRLLKEMTAERVKVGQSRHRNIHIGAEYAEDNSMVNTAAATGDDDDDGEYSTVLTRREGRRRAKHDLLDIFSVAGGPSPGSVENGRYGPSMDDKAASRAAGSDELSPVVELLRQPRYFGSQSGTSLRSDASRAAGDDVGATTTTTSTTTNGGNWVLLLLVSVRAAIEELEMPQQELDERI